MYNTDAMFLIYRDSEGRRFTQHWQDLTEMGTLIDPETGEDLELIGWHSAVKTAPQAEVQEAWHAGLDEGREQGRGKDCSHQPQSASVGVEDHLKALRQMWQQCANDRRLIEADALNTAIEALAQQPAAVAMNGEDAVYACDVLQADGGWAEEFSREVPPDGFYSIRNIRRYAQQPAAVDGAWQVQLADALECFWNAAIEGSGRDRDNTIGGMVQGFAAVATRLREHAAQPGGSDNDEKNHLDDFKRQTND
jgi:hypothetical protein